MQFCNLKRKKNTQILPKLGALGANFPNKTQFYWFKCVFFLVCDCYLSIDIPKIVKIDQQTQAQVCMYVYIPTPGSQHCKMAFWSIIQEQACQCSKILMPFLSLSDSTIVIIILFLCFRILSIDYFEKAYKTCSILSWGAVLLKVVWKPVRKVPDLRHSMSMTKMSVIYTAWTFSRTCFFF